MSFRLYASDVGHSDTDERGCLKKAAEDFWQGKSSMGRGWAGDSSGVELRITLRRPPPPCPPTPFGAWMFAILNGGLLWWFFWMQFLVSFYFNGMPWFSDVFGSAMALESLHQPVGGFSWTLVEAFLGIGLLLSLGCLGSTWAVSRGLPSRWRMRVWTATFTVFVIGHPLTLIQAKEGHIENLEWWITTMDNGRSDSEIMERYWGGDRRLVLDVLDRAR